MDRPQHFARDAFRFSRPRRQLCEGRLPVAGSRRRSGEARHRLHPAPWLSGPASVAGASEGGYNLEGRPSRPVPKKRKLVLSTGKQRFTLQNTSPSRQGWRSSTPIRSIWFPTSLHRPSCNHQLFGEKGSGRLSQNGEKHGARVVDSAPFCSARDTRRLHQTRILLLFRCVLINIWAHVYIYI